MQEIIANQFLTLLLSLCPRALQCFWSAPGFLFLEFQPCFVPRNTIQHILYSVKKALEMCAHSLLYTQKAQRSVYNTCHMSILSHDGCRQVTYVCERCSQWVILASQIVCFLVKLKKETLGTLSHLLLIYLFTRFKSSQPSARLRRSNYQLFHTKSKDDQIYLATCWRFPTLKLVSTLKPFRFLSHTQYQSSLTDILN